MKIFSGIRPTGDIHLGNYLGAIKQWIELQEKEDCLFCVVDWHAITTPYDEKTLQDKIFDLSCSYLAAGLDPKKCSLFIQSQVKEHSELAWLLGTIIPLGELKRMTQFKDKSQKHSEYINAGLLNYPILMAADILLYKTEAVPIGKDQVQHLELTRNVAEKFNKKYGKTFIIPKPMLPKQGAVIMSLTDPNKKMSKSDDGKGCIGLFENPKEIEKKIMSATTDSDNEIRYDLEKKSGISNLLTIYSLFSNQTIKQIEKEFKGKGYGDFKKSLSQLLIKKLEPLRIKKQDLMKNPDLVYSILDKGAKEARKKAEQTMIEIRNKMGLK
ncbi:MAG: tryptophan--tRNA ligase [Candidatus Pacebacteria bacterium]|nr:tryptophan--tRNA ligase [Candidatus Paceibacterota bacterium]MDD5013211.1 tryptophan--tRNA ligase [Candidatus Paceibacterota bacterium]